MTYLHKGDAAGQRERAAHTISFLLIATPFLLAGCAVGPHFKKPALPAVDSYTAQPLKPTASANAPGGEVQTFALGGDITADWWTLYH